MKHTSTELHRFVIPAQAGIHLWIRAFGGFSQLGTGFPPARE
ncbi:TPA: hypothetical protein ACFP30_000077 [Neisseria oralis]